MAPKDVYTLIFRTVEYVHFHGKRDVADIIRLKYLEME